MQIILIVISVLLVTAFNGGDRAREANHAYESGDYQRAESLYRGILQEHPEDRRILFNLGNTLARQGETDESIEMFRRYRDLADVPEERAPAEYNMGYLYGDTGNTDVALEHFERAITLDPADEDAKYNYELLKRRQQNSPDENQEKEDEQQDEQPDSGRPPPASDSGRPRDDDPAQQPASSPPDELPRTEDEQQGGQPEISRDQLDHAEDIMNALEQIEKDLIKDFIKRKVTPVDPYEKDW